MAQVSLVVVILVFILPIAARAAWAHVFRLAAELVARAPTVNEAVERTVQRAQEARQQRQGVPKGGRCPRGRIAKDRDEHMAQCTR